MRLFTLMIAVACVATPATANSAEDDARSVTIPLAGVRFDDPQSVADLRRRIDRAVRFVCEPTGATLSEWTQARACRTSAQKSSERLLAQHLGQTRMAAFRPK